MKIKLGTFFYSPYKYEPVPAIELAPPLFMYHVGQKLLTMWTRIREQLTNTVFLAHYPYYSLEPELAEKIATKIAEVRPDATVAFAVFPGGTPPEARDEILKEVVKILITEGKSKVVSLKHPRPDENLSFARILEWSEQIEGLIPDIFINSMYGRAYHVLGPDKERIEEELVKAIAVALEVTAMKNDFAVIHYSPFIVGPGGFTYTQTGSLQDTVLTPHDVGVLLKEAERIAKRVPKYAVFIYNNRYQPPERRVRDLKIIADSLRATGHEVEL